MFPRSIETSTSDLEGNSFSEKNSCLNQNLVRKFYGNLLIDRR